MKIAVTAKGKDMDAEVDPRFGRAPYFLLYDTEDDDFTVLDNKQNLNAEQGVGVQAGQNIINAGVSALITGNCGPKAFRVLSASSVSIYIGAKGTVREAIEAYKAGSLSAADSANVEGHWS